MESLILSTAMASWMDMVLVMDFNLELVFIFSIGGLGRRRLETCFVLLLFRQAPWGAVRPWDGEAGGVLCL